MSQSAKRRTPQEPSKPAARYGWARAAGEGVLGEAAPGFARAGFTDPTLVLRWSEIVGPEVARLAWPVKWQDGPEGAVLTLKCDASAAVLLQHQTRGLIERLNAYLGAGRIARLRLLPGRLSEVTEPSRHPAPDFNSAAERLDLPDALARLGQLRARLRPPKGERPD